MALQGFVAGEGRRGVAGFNAVETTRVLSALWGPDGAERYGGPCQCSTAVRLSSENRDDFSRSSKPFDDIRQIAVPRPSVLNRRTLPFHSGLTACHSATVVHHSSTVILSFQAVTLPFDNCSSVVPQLSITLLFHSSYSVIPQL